MLLEVKNLIKTYKHGRVLIRAVNDISFQVKEQEMMGIIGESGSGKSTLIRLICQFSSPDSGQILFNGTDITHLPAAQKKKLYRHLQLVFQNPVASFHPRFTLGKSIRLGMKNYHIESSDIDFQKLLEEVHLTPDHLSRYPQQVSGGECQRAAILRALCLQPKLLICDEATSALDVSIRSEIAALIRTVCHHHHIACLFITHDLYLARQLCDTLIVMNQGKIVERGQTEAIFTHPQTDYTKLLLESCL